MAFINENIITDEQKEKFCSFNLYFLGEPVKIPKCGRDWYRDAERDLYFMRMGGGSFEIPEIYYLITPQGLITIERYWPRKEDAEMLAKTPDEEKHRNTFWNIETIIHPRDMTYSAEYIKELVINAVEDYVRSASTDKKEYKAVIYRMAEPTIYNDWEEKNYVTG